MPQLMQMISSKHFTELLAYYGERATHEQKLEVYLARLTYRIYRLEQTWSTGLPEQKVEDFIVKPATGKRRKKKQSPDDMQMMMHLLAGDDPSWVQSQRLLPSQQLNLPATKIPSPS